MDPALTLFLILESLKDRDTDSAHAYLTHLTDWMDKGGFVPGALQVALDAIRDV